MFLILSLELKCKKKTLKLIPIIKEKEYSEREGIMNKKGENLE